jgi:zinc/manganese transport system substrate-binding protein
MPPMSHRLSAISATVAAASLAFVGSGPAVAQDATGSVVVTTEVLGSVVEQLVGEVGEVTVIMPSGANPHSYEPSARDAERMLNADVLVSNGLELEEALVSILESAESEGVTWFQAADHITPMDLEDHDGHEGEDHDEDTDQELDEDTDHEHDEDTDHEHDEHDHGSEDPHIWTDPGVMIDVVTALEPVLADAGIDVSVGAEVLISDLQALDAEVEEIVAAVPDEDRKLVTGHESLGYFADRYGFQLVGTVIPGLSTSGEPTARELAQLIEDISENDVSVVFAEVGTPQAVAEAVASDSGARLVPLATSQLPEGGTYQDLIREIAVTVAGALAG